MNLVEQLESKIFDEELVISKSYLMNEYMISASSAMDILREFRFKCSDKISCSFVVVSADPITKVHSIKIVCEDDVNDVSSLNSCEIYSVRKKKSSASDYLQIQTSQIDQVKRILSESSVRGDQFRHNATSIVLPQLSISEVGHRSRSIGLYESQLPSPTEPQPVLTPSISQPVEVISKPPAKSLSKPKSRDVLITQSSQSVEIISQPVKIPPKSIPEPVVEPVVSKCDDYSSSDDDSVNQSSSSAEEAPTPVIQVCEPPQQKPQPQIVVKQQSNPVVGSSSSSSSAAKKKPTFDMTTTVDERGYLVTAVGGRSLSSDSDSMKRKIENDESFNNKKKPRAEQQSESDTVSSLKPGLLKFFKRVN